MEELEGVEAEEVTMARAGGGGRGSRDGGGGRGAGDGADDLGLGSEEGRSGTAGGLEVVSDGDDDGDNGSDDGDARSLRDGFAFPAGLVDADAEDVDKEEEGGEGSPNISKQFCSHSVHLQLLDLQSETYQSLSAPSFTHREDPSQAEKGERQNEQFCQSATFFRTEINSAYRLHGLCPLGLLPE